MNCREYPAWGTFTERVIPTETLPLVPSKHTLTVFQSTSVAGNDLLASVLYSTGIVCAACGQLGPIAMLLAVLTLFPFRRIFQENGTILPLNGGVYANLLNATSKTFATFAASCSLITYSATAVVSAASCTSYAAGAFGSFPIEIATVAVLAAFAILVLFGIKDSANVASTIFAFHIGTLVLFVFACSAEIVRNGGSILIQNWQSPLQHSESDGYIGWDMFFGYSVSLLGLTGFETASNYIEEAGPFHTTTHNDASRAPNKRTISVFEKTISNMYWLVLLVNPTVVLICLGTTYLGTIVANPDNILSVVSQRVGGHWLNMLVSVDAVAVLSGGVLTAYVGVIGLIQQLAYDRCLPLFLTQTNPTFRTNHWIIMFFFLFCATLYLITGGDVTILSGVFSLSFLMVMLSFAAANMMLKIHRARLPRVVSASWPAVLLGFSSMFAGFIGIVLYNPGIFGYFILYLAVYFFVITVTFQRVAIAKALLFVSRQVPVLDHLFSWELIQKILSMQKFSCVFFTDCADLYVLNDACAYVRDNENCDHIIIAHIVCPDSDPTVPPRLRENLRILDDLYPKMKVDVLLVSSDLGFTPRVVKHISDEIDIPMSFMFIRCPGENFKFNLGEFQGVRSIMQ